MMLAGLSTAAGVLFKLARTHAAVDKSCAAAYYQVRHPFRFSHPFLHSFGCDSSIAPVTHQDQALPCSAAALAAIAAPEERWFRTPSKGNTTHSVCGCRYHWLQSQAGSTRGRYESGCRVGAPGVPFRHMAHLSSPQSGLNPVRQFFISVLRLSQLSSATKTALRIKWHAIPEDVKHGARQLVC